MWTQKFVSPGQEHATVRSAYQANYVKQGSNGDTYRAANGTMLYDCSTHWTVKPHDIAHLDALTCGQNVIPVTHK